MPRPEAFVPDDLTPELLRSNAALAVTDFYVAVTVWKNDHWHGASSDSPTLLVYVTDLSREYVEPVRQRVVQLGLGSGLVPPGALGI